MEEVRHLSSWSVSVSNGCLIISLGQVQKHLSEGREDSYTRTKRSSVDNSMYETLE